MHVILYKGAGPGTHWWSTDPRLTGGFLASPGVADVNSLIRHIVRFSHPSPCLSFTASFDVARSYALTGPKGVATTSMPGYVYEVDSGRVPGLKLRDPALEILSANPIIGSTSRLPTHHDGGQNIILAIASPVRFKAVLLKPPFRAGSANLRPPLVTDELHAVIFALRDAEVMTELQVPAACIVHRHDVY